MIFFKPVIKDACDGCARVAYVIHDTRGGNLQGARVIRVADDHGCAKAYAMHDA